MDEAVVRPTLGWLYEFLLSVPHGVLSTLEVDGSPHGSFVAFSANQELELMFGTAMYSRKAANLRWDNRFCLTVSDAERRFTLQYHGVARRLHSDQLLAREPEHYAKHPESEKWRDRPDQVYFGGWFTEIVFWDCNPDPFVATTFVNE
jgi:hypothetical protein